MNRTLEESLAWSAAAMAALPTDAWQSEVVTAQGRVVPASETPWMRSREVMVHAVDLEVGLSFADLPEGFLTALRAGIIGKRGAQNVPDVHGRTAAVTAYLAGRLFTDVTTPDGQRLKDGAQLPMAEMREFLPLGERMMAGRDGDRSLVVRPTKG